MCARAKLTAQFVAQSSRSLQLSIARGALEFASCNLREQPYRKPVLHYPVELEDVILEVDVLEEDAESPLISHLLDERAGDQAARRVHGAGDVPLEWYGSPQPLGHPLAQRSGG